MRAELLKEEILGDPDFSELCLYKYCALRMF